MSLISVLFKTADGSPLVAPTDLPEVTIRRVDTQAIVAGPSAMVEIGEGNFSFSFVPVSTLEYTISADGDPNVILQVPPVERFKGGSLSGIEVNEIINNIPAILAAVAALNDLSIADVQTAMTNQGYTAARAILLDNIDALISSRATQAQILSDATPFPGANVDATISAVLAAIAALNNLSQADVQTAMTTQGYTSARAILLDNLDALISSRSTPAQVAAIETNILAAIALLNDISIGDVMTAMTAQGYTSARAFLLDNLDALISSRSIPGDDANASQIAGSTQAATNMRESANLMEQITVDDSTFSPTTTEFEASGIQAAEDDVDHFVGRLVIFSDPGTLQRQARTITGYTQITSTKGKFTVAALTAIPANGAQAVIV